MKLEGGAVSAVFCHVRMTTQHLALTLLY